jgi:hypothetical protein
MQYSLSHIIDHLYPPLSDPVRCDIQIPVGRVVTMRTLDKSVRLVNTESWGYYACNAVSTAEAGKIVTNCNNKGFR